MDDIVPRLIATIRAWQLVMSVKTKSKKKAAEGLQFHVQRIRQIEAHSNITRLATMLYHAEMVSWYLSFTVVQTFCFDVVPSHSTIDT